MYSHNDIEYATRIIRNGFDGSGANRHAIITACNLLSKASNNLKTFANKKPGRVAVICNNMAKEYESITNTVAQIL